MDCLDENELLDLARGNLSSRPGATELEAHLDSCSDCRQVLLELLHDPGRQCEAVVLTRGASVDRYIALELVGRGAMAEVWAAYDPKLDRRIALKLLQPQECNPHPSASAGGRMLREAKALAKVNHPNVVAVHDAGMLGDQVFVAMDLVEGRSLRDWLEEESRPIAEILDAFRQAGMGLAAAHAQGLVHRDFKPDNVLVGNDGRVLVTDFGLVRTEGLEADVDPCSSDDGEEILLSSDGEVVGTPAYMAPEQLQGVATARSDQFSFCVALYEALFRCRPFAGDTLNAIRKEVLEGRVRPIIGRKVPSRVTRALLKGLARNHERRFPDMLSLVQELRPKPLLRNTGWWAAGVIALCAVSAIGVLRFSHRDSRCDAQDPEMNAVWSQEQKNALRQAFILSGQPGAIDLWNSVERTVDAYTAEWQAARRAACEATWVRGEQSEAALDLRMQCLEGRRAELTCLTRLLSAPNEDVVRAAPRAMEGLSRIQDCADVAGLMSPIHPPGGPETRHEVARIREMIAEANASRMVGMYVEALNKANVAVKAAHVLAYRPLLAEAEESLGLALRRMGELRAAEAALWEATWEAHATRHDVVAVRASTELVYLVGYRQGRAREAHQLERLAAAVLERMGPGHDDIRADLLRQSGAVLLSEGRLKEALQLQQQAILLAEKVYGPQSQALADSYNAAGVTLNDLGRYAEAERLHQQALAIREKTLGSQHLETATSLASVAIAIAGQGQAQKASELAERAIAIAETTLPPDHPDLGFFLHSVGRMHLMGGEARMALTLLRRAESLRRNGLGPNHPLLAITLLALGQTLHAMGNNDDAWSVLNQAMKIEEGRNTEPGPALANVLVSLAEVEMARGQVPSAIDTLERAVSIYHEAHATSAEAEQACALLSQAISSLGGARRPCRAELP